MIIGLTGGIGSGKSTVARMLAEKGYKIIDADAISKEVTSTDSIAIDELRDYFGDSILNEDGSIDRFELGKVAFENDMNLSVINSIITKRIIEISKCRLTGDCVYDAPTLLENNLESLVDVVMLVTAEEDLRIARVQKRSKYSIEHIKNIIKTQMPEEEKVKRSDIVIYNNGTLAELALKVTEALSCGKIKC